MGDPIDLILTLVIQGTWNGAPPEGQGTKAIMGPLQGLGRGLGWVEESRKNDMGSDDREVFHVLKPHLKTLAEVNASHELFNLGQGHWICLHASWVTYTQVGMTNMFN